MTGLGLMILVNNRKVLAFAIKGINAFYDDREDFLISLVRGFKPDKDYLARYRFKPCGALLSFIYDRVSTFDAKDFELNNKKYQVLFNYNIIIIKQIAVEEFTKAGILVPGYKVKERGFW